VRHLQVSKKEFSSFTGFSESGNYLNTYVFIGEKLFLGRDFDVSLAIRKASIV